MSTISELIVAANVDPSGMARGYTRAEQLTRDFAQSVNRIMAGTIAGTAGQGTAVVGQTAAENLIAGLREGLENRKGALREMLARGIIDQKQYEAMGKEAGASFNRGLLIGMDELKKNGLLTDDVRNQMVTEFESAGTSGGRSFAAAFTATVHRHRALIPTLAGLVLSQAIPAGADAIGKTGLEQTIEQAKSAEKILENVAMLASFVLDPIPGLIAAVVGGSAAAIIKIWSNAQEETAKARKAFTDELRKTIDDVDNITAQKNLQKVMFGTRSSGAADDQQNGYANGLLNLRAQTQRDQNAMAALERSLPAPIARTSEQRKSLEDLQKAIDDREPKIRELEGQRFRLEAALLFTPGDALGENRTGPIAPMKITAQAPLSDFERLVARAKELTEEFKKTQQLNLTPGGTAGGIGSKPLEDMLGLQHALNAALAEQTDQQSAHAKQLRETLMVFREIFGTATALSTKVPGLMPLIGRGNDVEPGGEGGRVSDITSRLAITTDLETRRHLLNDLANLHDVIRQRVTEEGGVLRANVQLVNAQREAEAAIAANRAVAGPPVAMGTPFDSLRNAVDRANALRNQAAGAQAFGAANAGDLEAAANAQRQRAIALIRGMLEATDKDTASTKEGRQALEDLLAIMNQLGDVTGKGASNFDGMKNAVRGVLDAAGGFGEMGREISQAGRSVLHVVDSLGALKKARDAASQSGGAGATMATIGAGLGVVGGVIGAIGAISALFGESPAAQEQKRLMQQNTDRLRELRVSLDNSLNTASGLGRETSAAKGLQTQFGVYGNSWGLLQQLLGGGKFIDQVKAASEKLGVSWDELTQKAKELGINLFDDKGRLLVGAFSQLVEALELERKRMTQFTDSFDDQKALSDLMGRVMGKTEPGDKYNSTLALLERFAPQLAKGLEGIDATTEEGRKKIEAALQALVAQLVAGSITLEQYGDLEGAKQLAAIIGLLQDSLDGMKGAVDSVTGSLLNVPEWYKVNAARVSAANPLGMPSPTDGGPSIPQSGGPISFIPPGSGPVSAGPQDRGSVTIMGDVLVDARELSADEIFSAVVKAGRRKAALQFGNASRWSDVQG